jgi:hypothetical protein
MRIVCWNMRGHGGLEEQITNFLESWGTDIAILLEPPSWMRHAIPNKLTATGEHDRVFMRDRPDRHVGWVNTEWRLKRSLAGHSQGHLCVAYKKGSAKVTSIQDFPVPTAAQDNRLVFISVTVGVETRTIATCHTVFGQLGSNEPANYNKEAMKLIKTTPGVHIDIWIGDLNTYSGTTPRGAQPEFQRVLTAPTSGVNQNSHYPLDQIFVRVPLNATATCGRILPNTSTFAGANGCVDIVEASWANEAAVKSDHLPIYVDTTPAIPVAPVALPPPPPNKFFSPPDPEPKRRKIT